MVADKKTVWACRPGEPARAYAYAWEYIRMGPSRSIEKVSQKVNRTARQLKRWSKRWQWVRRAAAYDRSIDAQNLEAAKRFAESEAEKWTKRESELRERVYLTADQMLERVKSMLGYPLAEVSKKTQVDTEGRAIEITTIQPARWTMDTAARLLQVGSAVSGAAIRNDGAVHTALQKMDTFDELSSIRILPASKKALKP